MQLDLPLASRTDPVTSHAAADKAASFKARQISLIFCCLQDYGPATYRELAARLQMEPVAIARRGAEMRRNGLISMGPDMRDGCQIWRAV